jgi:hypothetical protein
MKTAKETEALIFAGSNFEGKSSLIHLYLGKNLKAK